MIAQKHQKLNFPPPTNSAISTAPNYKCIAPAHVGDVNKPGVYMLAPAVLTVTNNS